MRCSLLSLRSRCSLGLHNGRSIRTRARLRQPERLAVNSAEPFTHPQAQQDAAAELQRARASSDQELADYVSGGKNANTETRQARAATEALVPASDSSKPTGRPRVSNEVFEWYSSGSLPPSHEQRIFANKFFTKHPKKLLFTAGKLYQVTHTDVPEVAFMGRSNVGKSTVLNAVLGEAVARVSARPGKTQTLNAWAVGGMDRTGQKHRLTVLDMPGYGFGSRAQWGATVAKYLKGRRELKRVFVLVSAKHGLKDSDKSLLAELREAAIPHQIVLAKADELLRTDKRKLTVHRQQHICGRSNLDKVINSLTPLIESIRLEAAGKNRRRGALPAVDEILACSGVAGGFAGMPPEPQGSLGISALRWAIVSATGLQPTVRVTDEKDLSF